MPRFAAKIHKIGINTLVDPPEDILDALFRKAERSSGPIPVRGKINSAEFTQTLVKYSGAWRLYINGPMLKNSNLSVGEIADVEIEFDPRPREVPVPKQLAAALQKHPNARTAFESLSPSRRKEIARYIGSLKTGESITRNIRRVIEMLIDDEANEGN